MHTLLLSLAFFFNDTATTEIYTLSLHDALPISVRRALVVNFQVPVVRGVTFIEPGYVNEVDRKSTRLNSSHLVISYAVFCLKKKRALNGRFNTSIPHAYSIVIGS